MTASGTVTDRIGEKVRQGERLTAEDGYALFEEADLLRLGRLAREVKERKSGRYVFFNVNRHLNLTNICVSKCLEDQRCIRGANTGLTVSNDFLSGGYPILSKQGLDLGFGS